jgi:hypothetical protein
MTNRSSSKYRITYSEVEKKKKGEVSLKALTRAVLKSKRPTLRKFIV